MRREVFDVPGFVARDLGRKQASAYRDGSKRLLDVAGAIVIGLLVLPIVAVLWLLVRRDGGPGFFAHERIGRDGKAFRCWKLRTMVPDAQARLWEHLRTNPDAMREWQQDYKLRNDPRVTRLGAVLRKTSLDELPQLWNVLTGDMSLVGPRPVPQSELVEYHGFERAYFLYRPGITGIWQTSGRNDTSYAERVRMDLDYARNACLTLDLRILVRTVGAVLRRTGC